MYLRLRLAYSHEFVIKFILLVVLAVLVLNIYILTLIIPGEQVKYKRTPDDLLIKAQPLKTLKYSHEGKKHSSKKVVFTQTNTTELASKKIFNIVSMLGKEVFGKIFSVKMKRSFQILLDDLKTSEPVTMSLINETLKWVGGRQLFAEPGSLPLGRALASLCSAKIEHADNTPLGTQLKLLLTLEGGFKAVFKPQWYRRSEVVKGSAYAGKDRHNGEVAAFHLAWMLGMRRAPLTVGRRINIRKEVMPVATPELLKTFYQEGNNTCFYGSCYYCGPHDPVCASQDILEGALILWLPQEFPLKKFRHPWQRTYKPNYPARWELDAGYCKVVRKLDIYSRGPRLLDIVDTAIFDFLIGNGDRHHYEVFQNINDSAILLIDNGKSFGNPHVDHIDILAPLYQCCRLRGSTWARLQWLGARTVREPLAEMLSWSHIAPVLTDAHLTAIDRRLLLTAATVHLCFQERNGQQNVIVAD